MVPIHCPVVKCCFVYNCSPDMGHTVPRPATSIFMHRYIKTRKLEWELNDWMNVKCESASEILLVLACLSEYVEERKGGIPEYIKGFS